MVAWRSVLYPTEIIVHEKYGLSREENNKIFYRKDYDIALLRVSYPIHDDDTGMLTKILMEFDTYAAGLSLLENGKVEKDTLMPICLPPNQAFEDTNRGKLNIIAIDY